MPSKYQEIIRKIRTRLVKDANGEESDEEIEIKEQRQVCLTPIRNTGRVGVELTPP